MATESTLRYIKLDFQSQKDAILQRIRSRYPLVWNDFLTSSLGVVLIDIIAWSVSTLAFTVNRLAAENFVSTMTLRESAIRIGSLVGYQLHGAVPSTVVAEARIPAAVPYSITILGGTIVRSSDKNEVTFEIDRDYLIAAGNTTPVTEIVLISALASGTDTIQSNLAVINGQPYMDLLDTTIDLEGYVDVGMNIQRTGSSDPVESKIYVIQSVSSSPGAVSNNRIVLDLPWAGVTGVISARVFDTRVTLLQGQTVTDRGITPSLDTPGYVQGLSRQPVIDGSVEATVNGENWLRVTSLSTQSSESRAFEVRTLSTGQTLIVFGDGIFGAQVPTEATVIATYRIGGGTVGNVEAGTISTAVLGQVLAPNDPVAVQIANPSTSGQGGLDAESLEEARVNIPAYTRTNDRAVTIEDYRTIATNFTHPQYGRVQYARASVRVQNSLLEGNIVVIYAWTSGASGGLVPLSTPLKTALRSYMQEKAVGTDYVLISDGQSRPLPLALRFMVFSGFGVSSTRNLVLNVLKAVVNNLVPGQTLAFSNLISTLDQVYGVDTVTPATPIADLRPATDSEIFTTPDDTYRYTIFLAQTTGTNYTGESPVTPLAPWAIQAYINGLAVLVLPDTTPGFARLISDSLVKYGQGPLSERPAATDVPGMYWRELNSITKLPTLGGLAKSDGSIWVASTDSVSKSTIDMRTGDVVLSGAGVLGSCQLSLITATGYDRVRLINIYIGYQGTVTQSKRRELRATIKAALDGNRVGAPIYAQEVVGVQESILNIRAICMGLPGVTSILRISLDTPSSALNKIDAADNELLSPGSIIINNEAD